MTGYLAYLVYQRIGARVCSDDEVISCSPFGVIHKERCSPSKHAVFHISIFTESLM